MARRARGTIACNIAISITLVRGRGNNIGKYSLPYPRKIDLELSAFGFLLSKFQKTEGLALSGTISTWNPKCKTAFFVT
jgi:hypothetical protein